jgi:hypothetical protein
VKDPAHVTTPTVPSARATQGAANAVREEADEALGELVAQLRAESLAPASTPAEQKARTDARRLLIETVAALRRADRPARVAVPRSQAPEWPEGAPTHYVDLPPLDPPR